MNRVRRLLSMIGVVKLKPHEKAELGQATWGRQPEPTTVVPVSAKPKATVSVRVIRKDGTTEDLGIISGGK